jgi:hypothetical protein
VDRAEEMPLHRAFAEPEHVGDPAVDRPSICRSANTSRCRAGRRPYAAQMRACVSRPMISSSGVRTSERDGRRSRRRAAPPAPPARSAAIAARVHGDARQPRAQSIAASRFDGVMELREHVLRGVGGLVGVGQEHAAEPRDPVAMRPVERVVAGHLGRGRPHRLDERARWTFG